MMQQRRRDERDRSFTKAGVYRFTTKAGEDYTKGIKTVGEDNVLRPQGDRALDDQRRLRNIGTVRFSTTVILENGVIRTLDPSLPTARALAIAGDTDRRRRRHARDRARVAGGRRSRRPLRAARLHRLARALRRVGSRAARGALRGNPDVGGGRRARARGRRLGPARRLAARPRLAERRLVAVGRADAASPRRGHRRRPDRSHRARRSLDVAELRSACARGRRPARGRRRRRGRRARRADGRPARGVGVALPREVRRGVVQRERGDGRRARRAEARRVAWSDCDPRRGHERRPLDRRPAVLRAAGRGRRADAACVAVDPPSVRARGRAARSARRASGAPSSGSAR